MSTAEVVPAVVLSAFGAGLAVAGQGIYRRWDVSGLSAFTAFVVLTGLGGFLAGVVALVSSRIWVSTVFHQCVELGALAWGVFTLQYTGRDYLLTRRLVAGVAIGYALFWLASLVPVLNVFPGVGLTTVIPVFRYLAGLVFVLLGSTLLLQTTVQHGYLSAWGAVALNTVAFVPWVLLLVGFAVDEIGAGTVYLLYAGSFLGITGLLVGTLVWSDIFEVTVATQTLGRRALVAETPDLIAVVDEDDRIVELNDATLERLAVERDVYGEPITVLFGEDTASLRDRENVDLQTATGVRQFDAQVVGLSNDGEAPMGSLISLRDITERRQREQILDVLNRVLRHNLRNELSVIEGRTTLVRERVADESLADHLDISQRSVDSLVDLGNQAQSISQALAQDQTRSVVDVTACARDVGTAVRETLGYGTVEVAGEDIDVRTNRHLLRLALRNAVENALEHSTAETPRVSITVRETEDGVRVRIDDNGPGIPQSETAVIQKGEETPVEHTSSIGLWIIHWAATSCGGTVEFGDADRGGRVELWVPDQSGTDH